MYNGISIIFLYCILYFYYTKELSQFLRYTKPKIVVGILRPITIVHHDVNACLSLPEWDIKHNTFAQCQRTLKIAIDMSGGFLFTSGSQLLLVISIRHMSRYATTATHGLPPSISSQNQLYFAGHRSFWQENAPHYVYPLQSSFAPTAIGRSKDIIS